jgi:broad specificity phosphatase PhoE
VILYLIRHGQTAHNRDALGLGRADVPLTAFGVRQAEALGARLAGEPINHIFASPLGRAQETARAVAAFQDAAVEVRDELIEMDVGETEGLTFPEMHERHPEFLKLWASDDCADAVMPGGESLRDVAKRLDPFIEELRLLPDERIAIVTHNFVIKVLFCRLLGLDLHHFREISIDLASITTITLHGSRVNVRALNDCCHLRLLEP